MTSRTGGSGALEVSGTVNEPAQVSIAGQPASALWKRSDGQYGFRGTAQVSSGANQVAVTATDGSGWEHRAYWGANQIPWGTDGTESRRYQGSLPATGQWVRLEVDAASVGLSGRSISGMAYSQVGGQADWDHSGKVSATGIETTYVDDTLPAGATPYGTWTWSDTGLSTPVAFTGHHYHPRSTLHLAPYRVYSAELGRWISRDPIEEAGGINLFAYVTNGPQTHTDATGLKIDEVEPICATPRDVGNKRKESFKVIATPGTIDPTPQKLMKLFDKYRPAGVPSVNTIKAAVVGAVQSLSSTGVVFSLWLEARWEECVCENGVCFWEARYYMEKIGSYYFNEPGVGLQMNVDVAEELRQLGLID
jgi:RHS repeat-associated protein